MPDRAPAHVLRLDADEARGRRRAHPAFCSEKVFTVFGRPGEREGRGGGGGGGGRPTGRACLAGSSLPVQHSFNKKLESISISAHVSVSYTQHVSYSLASRGCLIATLWVRVNGWFPCCKRPADPNTDRPDPAGGHGGDVGIGAGGGLPPRACGPSP